MGIFLRNMRLVYGVLGLTVANAIDKTPNSNPLLPNDDLLREPDHCRSCMCALKMHTKTYRNCQMICENTKNCHVWSWETNDLCTLIYNGWHEFKSKQGAHAGKLAGSDGPEIYMPGYYANGSYITNCHTVIGELLVSNATK